MPRPDEKLMRAAVPVGPPLDHPAVRERARQLRRRRVMVGCGATAGFVLLVIGAAWLASLRGTMDVASDVLAIPPPGEASGQFLADETPVWVTRTRRGEVYVLEARHPEPAGMHASATHAILCDDPLLESSWGSRFAPDGTALSGPAPHGLRLYEIEEIGEGHVAVGAVSASPQPLDHPSTAGDWYRRGLPWCPRDPVLVPHPAWADTFESWYRNWYEDRPEGSVRG